MASATDETIGVYHQILVAMTHRRIPRNSLMNSVVNSFQTVTRSIVSRAISAMVTESMPVVHKSHHVVDPVLDALVVRFQDAKFLNQNDVI